MFHQSMASSIINEVVSDNSVVPDVSVVGAASGSVKDIVDPGYRAVTDATLPSMPKTKIPTIDWNTIPFGDISDLEKIRNVFSIPEEINIVYPQTTDLGTDEHPLIYLGLLKAGLRLPVPSFMADALEYFQVSINRVMSWFVRNVTYMHILGRKHDIVVTCGVIAHFFKLLSYNNGDATLSAKPRGERMICYEGKNNDDHWRKYAIRVIGGEWSNVTFDDGRKIIRSSFSLSKDRVDVELPSLTTEELDAVTALIALPNSVKRPASIVPDPLLISEYLTMSPMELRALEPGVGYMGGNLGTAITLYPKEALVPKEVLALMSKPDPNLKKRALKKLNKPPPEVVMFARVSKPKVTKATKRRLTSRERIVEVPGTGVASDAIIIYEGEGRNGTESLECVPPSRTKITMETPNSLLPPHEPDVEMGIDTTGVENNDIFCLTDIESLDLVQSDPIDGMISNANQGPSTKSNKKRSQPQVTQDVDVRVGKKSKSTSSKSGTTPKPFVPVPRVLGLADRPFITDQDTLKDPGVAMGLVESMTLPKEKAKHKRVLRATAGLERMCRHMMKASMDVSTTYSLVRKNQDEMDKFTREKADLTKELLISKQTIKRLESDHDILKSKNESQADEIARVRAVEKELRKTREKNKSLVKDLEFTKLEHQEVLKAKNNLMERAFHFDGCREAWQTDRSRLNGEIATLKNLKMHYEDKATALQREMNPLKFELTEARNKATLTELELTNARLVNTGLGESLNKANAELELLRARLAPSSKSVTAPVPILEAPEGSAKEITEFYTELVDVVSTEEYKNGISSACRVFDIPESEYDKRYDEKLEKARASGSISPDDDILYPDLEVDVDALQVTLENDLALQKCQQGSEVEGSEEEGPEEEHDVDAYGEEELAEGPGTVVATLATLRTSPEGLAPEET